MEPDDATGPLVRPWRRLPVRFALLLVLLLLATYEAGPLLQGLGETLLDRIAPLEEPTPIEREQPFLNGIVQGSKVS